MGLKQRRKQSIAVIPLVRSGEWAWPWRRSRPSIVRLWWARLTLSKIWWASWPFEIGGGNACIDDAQILPTVHNQIMIQNGTFLRQHSCCVAWVLRFYGFLTQISSCRFEIRDCAIWRAALAVLLEKSAQRIGRGELLDSEQVVSDDFQV